MFVCIDLNLSLKILSCAVQISCRDSFDGLVRLCFGCNALFGCWESEGNGV